MSEPSAKRPRIDSNDNTTEDDAADLDPALQAEIIELINTLPEGCCRELLSLAASMHSDILMSTRVVNEAINLNASVTVYEFDAHTRATWRDLNVTFRKCDASAQCEMAPCVENAIIDSIDQICYQAAKPMASFRTKINGLNALRKIAKFILLTSSPIALEMQMRCQWDDSLVEGMKGIVAALTCDERKWICHRDDRRQRWQDKFNELILLGGEKGCLEGLDYARDMFFDDCSDEEEEEEEEDDDDDDDEEEGNQSQGFDADGNEDQDDERDENEDGTT
ncbi:hypothetical protein Plec18167_004773 [Paecilomyces lecythidis]|uniref:Uncharacterized protein n=1 Tax=Paecilomyces lecythidis TaxID=3004212 RepID=A0ABR3XQE3_9EURO